MNSAMRMLVAEILNCSPGAITAMSGLGIDPRWDSIAQLNIMLALEERYGVEITDDTIRQFSRFDALEAFVVARGATAGHEPA